MTDDKLKEAAKEYSEKVKISFPMSRHLRELERLSFIAGAQHIRQTEVAELKEKYIWLIRHAWLCSSISKAKAADLLGVSLIDFDNALAKLGKNGGGE